MAETKNYYGVQI